MKQRCPARTWTHHGSDSLQCDLSKGHEGRHAIEGMFGFQFDKDEVGASRPSKREVLKHFFNVLMWIILMVIPVIILQLADFFKAVVWKVYWPYKDWVERTFPTR